MKKILFLIVASLLILGLIALPGCGGAGQEEEEEEEEEQPVELTIGVLQSLGWVVGLDGYHGMQVGADEFNKNGGVSIGGTKYKITLDLYNVAIPGDLTDELTGAQKLIADGCDYILGECFIFPAVNLTDQNHVITIASTYDAMNLAPVWNWQWSGAAGSTTYAAAVAILAKFTAGSGPENRTYQGVFPDRFDGHLVAPQHGAAAASAGLTVLEPIFYNPDLSGIAAVGTTIATRDPDILDGYGGGPPLDAAVIKAAYDAGWRGQSFGCSTAPGMAIMGIAGADAAEGYVALGWPTEFGTTAMASQFIADYTAKFGSWDFPEIVVAQELWLLIDAMKKAGSIDPAAVKAALDSGMTFESPCGKGQMIPRPDLGNSRTVDSVNYDLPIKKITGGNVTVVGTVSLAQILGVAHSMYGSW